MLHTVKHLLQLYYPLAICVFSLKQTARNDNALDLNRLPTVNNSRPLLLPPPLLGHSTSSSSMGINI
jgi:hypothetical protein